MICSTERTRFCDWLVGRGASVRSAAATATKLTTLLGSIPEPTDAGLNRAFSYLKSRANYRAPWELWVESQESIPAEQRSPYAGLQPSGRLVRTGRYGIPEDATDQLLGLVEAGAGVHKLAEATWDKVAGFYAGLDRVRLWAKPQHESDPVVPLRPELATPMGARRIAAILDTRRRILLPN
jgi:hypothetical protein